MLIWAAGARCKWRSHLHYRMPCGGRGLNRRHLSLWASTLPLSYPVNIWNKINKHLLFRYLFDLKSIALQYIIYYYSFSSYSSQTKIIKAASTICSEEHISLLRHAIQLFGQWGLVSEEILPGVKYYLNLKAIELLNHSPLCANVTDFYQYMSVSTI